MEVMKNTLSRRLGTSNIASTNSGIVVDQLLPLVLLAIEASFG
jgi:hypothetical protein